MRTPKLLFAFGVSFLTLAGFVLACSSSSSSSSSPPATGDVDGGSSSSPDATPESAAVACDPACQALTVKATFGGSTVGFDRGQFGTQQADGGLGYYVEVHAGGDPACPQQSSPTPDRTFVVTGIPRVAAGAVVTEADGVHGAYLDFVGDASAPLERASKITVTLTAVDSAMPAAWLAFDVDATFPSGKVSGHVYATYCDSLSGP
jgi:hypothetical protein